MMFHREAAATSSRGVAEGYVGDEHLTKAPSHSQGYSK